MSLNLTVYKHVHPPLTYPNYRREPPEETQGSVQWRHLQGHVALFVPSKERVLGQIPSRRPDLWALPGWRLGWKVGQIKALVTCFVCVAILIHQRVSNCNFLPPPAPLNTLRGGWFLRRLPSVQKSSNISWGQRRLRKQLSRVRHRLMRTQWETDTPQRKMTLTAQRNKTWTRNGQTISVTQTLLLAVRCFGQSICSQHSEANAFHFRIPATNTCGGVLSF